MSLPVYHWKHPPGKIICVILDRLEMPLQYLIEWHLRPFDRRIMDPISAAATLGMIAGALLALGVILKALFSTYRFFRGVDDASKIIKELPEWQAKVNLAMKELHPNSGSSLKDQVTAMNRKLTENHEKIIETADAIIEANRQIFETNEKVDYLGNHVDTLGNSLEEIRHEIMNHVNDDHSHSR